VVDSDLEGSCGLKGIREKCPEVYVKSGVMERGNFLACAGFGFADSGRQGVFGTFAAFQEMIISEVTMARLNRCNVLCHFSHSGVDDMADNMCHFGINNFFADTGLETEPNPSTHLFFPADVHQMQKVVEAVFWEQGLRFVYSTRSKVPEILTEEGKPFFGGAYEFQKGRDDILLKAGPDCGYVVSYGDALYRAHDAVLQLRAKGLQVGLVNKCHVNVPDEEMLSLVGKASFVLVVESQSTKTGLGVRMGTWLLERGLTPKFERAGTHLDGCGGLWEHAYHQGYDPESLVARIQKLSKSAPRA
jgi:transketolase C-terminal domain/subunit